MMAAIHPVVPERLETLVLARLSTSANDPPTTAALAKTLHRYAPTTLEEAEWRELVSRTLRGLQDQGLVTVKRQLVGTDELLRRVGPHTARRWRQWSDRALPALALGVRPDDTRSHARLSGRDGWAAAIAGRVLQLWASGPPPSSASLCDALVWHELGLDGVPSKCPAGVRAHFLRKHIAANPGLPDQLLRLLATRAVNAPRPELGAILAGLVRLWLTGRTVAARSASSGSTPADPRSTELSLVEAVRGIADEARDGVFGDRKVFISSVWNALRVRSPWSALELDDFKARLVAAHRNQELVLARADLVAAMDPALVASSETRTDGATFHFIVREPSR